MSDLETRLRGLADELPEPDGRATEAAHRVMRTALAQAGEECAELIELGPPALKGIAIALHQTSQTRDLHGERVIGARSLRDQVEPSRERGLLRGKAKRAAAESFEI